MPKLKIEGLLDVSCESDVIQRLPDGTRLYADVYRPAASGTHPVLLVRMPYDKRTVENMAYAHPCWYARRGYMVVIQDVRGRWRSEGEFYPFLSEEEDGALAVEWAARLPGSNGSVGMYGFSYAGATQLLAACAQPPSLRAIAPAMTASQFHEGWIYRGGALSLSFALSWAADLAAGQALRSGDDELACSLSAAAACQGSMTHLPLDRSPQLRAAGASARFFFDWLEHPTNDEYWQRWSIERRYERIQVPSFHIGGWYDIFLSGVLKNYVGTSLSGVGGGQNLTVGPWSHMPWTQRVGCLDFGPEARSQMDRLQLSFFDRHLLGKGDTPTDPVSVFVMGENRWRSFGTWPPAEAAAVTLFLRSGGGANTSAGDGRLEESPPQFEPPDVYVYSPLMAVGSAGGASCCFASISPMGPAEQTGAEAGSSVLVYSSAPFEKNRLVVGSVIVRLWAVSTARDTDFTAKLCLVDRNLVSTNLCGGIVRARYRNPAEPPSLIEPGTAYLYTIDLGATAIRVASGQSLRLQISSSDFPQWDRNMNTGGVLATEPASAAVVATQFVLHEASHPSRLEFSEIEMKS